MRVVIMGCGRVGAYLAALLDKDGHQVTVLDVNPSSFDRLVHSFKGSALLGDGTDEDSLRRAGIEEADAFVLIEFYKLRYIAEIFEILNTNA